MKKADWYGGEEDDGSEEEASASRDGQWWKVIMTGISLTIRRVPCEGGRPTIEAHGIEHAQELDIGGGTSIDNANAVPDLERKRKSLRQGLAQSQGIR